MQNAMDLRCSADNMIALPCKVDWNQMNGVSISKYNGQTLQITCCVGNRSASYNKKEAALAHKGPILAILSIA